MLHAPLPNRVSIIRSTGLPKRYQVPLPFPDDIGYGTQTQLDPFQYFDAAHKGALVLQDSESLDDLYHQLDASNKQVAMLVQELAIVYAENTSGLRRGGTLKDMGERYSFFHHQTLKRDRDLQVTEESYLKSLSIKHAIEGKLLSLHLDICSRRIVNTRDSLTDYDHRHGVQKVSLLSQFTNPATPPDTPPPETPPPSSPTLTNVSLTMSTSSTLYTPSPGISSGRRGRSRSRSPSSASLTWKERKV